MQNLPHVLIILGHIPVAPRYIEVNALRDVLAARGIQRTPRTLQRTLVELSRHFPLRCNDIGRPYGWSWAPECSGEVALVHALARLRR